MYLFVPLHNGVTEPSSSQISDSGSFIFNDFIAVHRDCEL